MKQSLFCGDDHVERDGHRFGLTCGLSCGFRQGYSGEDYSTSVWKVAIETR